MAATRALGSDDQMKNRVAEIIREYSEQGAHRTGTDGDLASAQWMGERIQALGLFAANESFDFKRIDVKTARLMLGDAVIEGVPHYDCAYTDATGVSGALGPINSDAEIGVVTAYPLDQSPGGQALAQARQANRHKAIIVIAHSEMPPGATVFNAEHFKAPMGPPTLQVSNEYASAIQAAIDAGAQATVTAHCDYVDATATNIGAKITGSDPTLAPIVVMTPRSGWWACASERGGGIAAFFEIMRALAASKPKRDVIFTANTGHELGHTGLDHFLRARPELIAKAHLWIHLGANFAAKFGHQVALQFSDDRAKTLAAPFLANRNAAYQEMPIGPRPLGEARNIFDGGGRYVSILGRNGLFHHPADIWPDAVDLETTGDWVSALVELAKAAANE